MAANHLPVITGTDLGIWRRVVLIPFNVTIPDKEKDHDLLNKLQSEYSGILEWALQGCLSWQRIGLSTPDVITNAVANYRAEMDYIGQWLAECYEVKKACHSTAASLYVSYKAWSIANGFGVSSARTLGLKLADRGFSKRHSGGVIYEGLRPLV
jgi:putative DNA primase/helicase